MIFKQSIHQGWTDTLVTAFSFLYIVMTVWHWYVNEMVVIVNIGLSEKEGL